MQKWKSKEAFVGFIYTKSLICTSCGRLLGSKGIETDNKSNGLELICKWRLAIKYKFVWKCIGKGCGRMT